ncbi:hypothetical protein DFJ77DRAFT_468763 [Powellomyces hirtus]|nr:hypothetical protein DFJ77DRAFT_468763 [Powellomyces hirtus]
MPRQRIVRLKTTTFLHSRTPSWGELQQEEEEEEEQTDDYSNAPSDAYSIEVADAEWGSESDSSSDSSGSGGIFHLYSDSDADSNDEDSDDEDDDDGGSETRGSSPPPLSDGDSDDEIIDSVFESLGKDDPRAKLYFKRKRAARKQRVLERKTRGPGVYRISQRSARSRGTASQPSVQPKFSDGDPATYPELTDAFVDVEVGDDNKAKLVWLPKLGLLGSGGFPSGYHLFGHRRADGINIDPYLYGHPGGKRFRSPAEFAPHLAWLVHGDPSLPCPCQLCKSKQLPPARIAELLQRAGTTWDLGPTNSGSDSNDMDEDDIDSDVERNLVDMDEIPTIVNGAGHDNRVDVRTENDAKKENEVKKKNDMKKENSVKSENGRHKHIADPPEHMGMLQIVGTSIKIHSHTTSGNESSLPPANGTGRQDSTHRVRPDIISPREPPSGQPSSKRKHAPVSAPDEIDPALLNFDDEEEDMESLRKYARVLQTGDEEIGKYVIYDHYEEEMEYEEHDDDSKAGMDEEEHQYTTLMDDDDEENDGMGGWDVDPDASQTAAGWTLDEPHLDDIDKDDDEGKQCGSREPPESRGRTQQDLGDAKENDCDEEHDDRWLYEPRSGELVWCRVPLLAHVPQSTDNHHLQQQQQQPSHWPCLVISDRTVTTGFPTLAKRHGKQRVHAGASHQGVWCLPLALPPMNTVKSSLPQNDKPEDAKPVHPALQELYVDPRRSATNTNSNAINTVCEPSWIEIRNGNISPQQALSSHSPVSPLSQTQQQQQPSLIPFHVLPPPLPPTDHLARHKGSTHFYRAVIQATALADTLETFSLEQTIVGGFPSLPSSSNNKNGASDNEWRDTLAVEDEHVEMCAALRLGPEIIREGDYICVADRNADTPEQQMEKKNEKRPQRREWHEYAGREVQHLVKVYAIFKSWSTPATHSLHQPKKQPKQNLWIIASRVTQDSDDDENPEQPPQLFKFRPHHVLGRFIPSFLRKKNTDDDTADDDCDEGNDNATTRRHPNAFVGRNTGVGCLVNEKRDVWRGWLDPRDVLGA